MSDSIKRVVKDLQSIRDYIRWAVSRFNQAQLYYGHGTDNAWDEAVQLVLSAVHLPWDINPQVMDARLTCAERERVIELIERRVRERVPLPYLTGEAWFAGLPFYVDERVLIPRSPIAELIENGFAPWLAERPVQRVLDMCTGSGCIGIACAFAFTEAEVDLVDISTDALAVAERNVARHQLQERVALHQSDLFDQLPSQRYDLIVSNPPYVDAEDMASIPAEYRHEPKLALASGVDGLDATRRILRAAADYLSENGLLVVEVGNSEAALQETFPQVPFIWLEFERGGHGVFALTAEQLREFRAEFM